MRHHIPCTFAVIPFACDPLSLLREGEVKLCPLTGAKASVLQPLLREGLAEIALHGYCHVTFSAVKGYQEFSDRMPMETQRRLILRGRQHLEDVFGVKVRLYVPPWNVLGSTTATVLMEEGFCISSNSEYMLDAKVAELAQLPSATGIVETNRALLLARCLGREYSTVGTMIHDYDFLESDAGIALPKLEQFEKLLCDPPEMRKASRRLISIAMLESPEIGATRFQANRRFQACLQRSRICRRVLRGLRDVYWDTKSALRLARLIKCIP
jgi:hypothetical protein